MAIECAEKVWIPGSSPNGNFLHTRFTGEMPDSVKVKGTNDVSDLRGNSGNWISNDKYTSTEVVLILIKDGVEFKECAYNAEGNLTIAPPPPQNVVVDGFTINDQGGGNVNATWTSVTEQELDVYRLIRDGVEVGEHPAEGEGSPYQIDDSPGQGGTFAYVLVANLFNGDEQEVAMSSITL